MGSRHPGHITSLLDWWMEDADLCKKVNSCDTKFLSVNICYCFISRHHSSSLIQLVENIKVYVQQNFSVKFPLEVSELGRRQIPLSKSSLTLTMQLPASISEYSLMYLNGNIFWWNLSFSHKIWRFMAFWLVNIVITGLENEIWWYLGLIETQQLVLCSKTLLMRLLNLISCEISGDLVEDTS